MKPHLFPEVFAPKRRRTKKLGFESNPVWQLGKSDGELAQPAKDGVELFQAICEIYHFNTESYNQITEDYLRTKARFGDGHEIVSFVIGAFNLFGGVVIVAAEVALSRNIAEIAFNIGDEVFKWCFGLGIAMISIFFKVIWDELNKDPETSAGLTESAASAKTPLHR